MQGGKKYSYLSQELYPPLRRMEMEVNYTVRVFDSDEAESIIKERPTGLSQREIYDLAQSKQDNDLLKIAVVYFPNDATANINAASVALVKGNVVQAWIYLSKVENNPKAYNNLGVYYWLKGDTTKAKRYFEEAIEAGIDKEKSVANIQLLEK